MVQLFNWFIAYNYYFVCRQIMTELVETEEEYVKKLGHVCEVGIDVTRHIN